MAQVPFTRAQALTAGFVPYGSSENLLVHTRYPGFLFRVVETVDQAIACGGIYIEEAVDVKMYFGLDFLFAHLSGKLGEFGVPTGFVQEPYAQLAPSHYTYSSGQAESMTYASSVFREQGVAWTAYNNAGKYLAIISHADRGFILDRTKVSITPAESFEAIPVSNGQVIPWSVAAPGGYPAPAQYGKYSTLSGVTDVSVYLPHVSGYLQNAIPVKKRAFLQGAKAGFLAQMGDADQEVIDAYGEAIGEIVATYGADDTIVDDFALYPFLASSGSTIQFGASRRTLVFGSVATGGSGDGLMLRRYDPVAKQEDNTWPPSVPNETAKREQVGYLVAMSHEKSVEGIPTPMYILQGFPTSGSSPKMTPMLGASTRLLAAPGDTFTLDAVPFEKVKLFQADQLPASACFGRFGPKVMPAVPAPAEPRVLDLSNRVQAEVLGSVTGASMPDLPTGATPTAQEASAAKSEALLDAKASSYKHIIPYFTGFTRYIVETVNDLDIRAKAILKG